MPGGSPIQIVGNLTADPESRQAGGASVVSFSVAVTDRIKEGDDWVDGNTTFHSVQAWRELGEHAAASLRKGMRVIVNGRIKSRSYETNAGEKRVAWEIEADEIGPSLKYATATVERAGRNANQAQRREQFDQQQGRYPAGNGQRPPAGDGNVLRQEQKPDPWTNPSAYDDETPF